MRETHSWASLGRGAELNSPCEGTTYNLVSPLIISLWFRGWTDKFCLSFLPAEKSFHSFLFSSPFFIQLHYTKANLQWYALLTAGSRAKKCKSVLWIFNSCFNCVLDKDICLIRVCARERKIHHLCMNHILRHGKTSLPPDPPACAVDPELVRGLCHCFCKE